MSKVNSPAILTRDSLPDAPEGAWIDTMLDSANSFNDQVRTFAQNGFSIDDNSPWKFVTLNLQHGIEYEIKNPFNDTSTAVKSVIVSKALGLGIAADGRPDGNTYPITQPQIAWRPSGKPSNSVFVTVQYPPPLGAASMTRLATQSGIAQGVVTPINWTDIELLQGAISWVSGANTRLTFASAGRVLISAGLQWNFSVPGGTYREFTIRVSNGRKVAFAFDAIAGGSAFVAKTFAGEYSVVPGDFANVTVAHDSGTAGEILADANNRPFFQARYVAPDPSTTARVELLFMTA